MATVDSFKSSLINFNNQWIQVETTTTKQKLPTQSKITSVNATTNLEISSSINCVTPDRMEIIHNVSLNGWLIQTISVFKPQIPTSSNSSMLSSPDSIQKQTNISISQESGNQNSTQPYLTLSPKSTAFGSCGEEEIEEEDEYDEIIDEEDQYDSDEKQLGSQYIKEECTSSCIDKQKLANSKQNQQQSLNDQLLLDIISKFPFNINLDDVNNKISPKKINTNGTQGFSRCPTTSSSGSSTAYKLLKGSSIQAVPEFQCDNIIEENEKKKKTKKASILTDDSFNETRQNFETEEKMSLQNSTSLTQKNIGSNASNSNTFKNLGSSISQSLKIYKVEMQSEEQVNTKDIQLQKNGGQTSPIGNISSGVEVALFRQSSMNESNNDMLQNSSCSQNEDSSNFSMEADKIYNQIIHRKRQILKKAIAKSSNNIDKPAGKVSSTNLKSNEANTSKYARKSSYLNSAKLASSPSLTNLNQKRDRKNLVKNFIKAFRGFINNQSDEDEVLGVLVKESSSKDRNKALVELNKIRKSFEEFIQKKNYNNSLMVELIQNQEFNIIFNHFLQEKAYDWIQSSKIKDKLSHEEALNHYLLSLKDNKALAKVRCLKYRSVNNIDDQNLSSPTKNQTNKQFVDFQ